MSRRRSARNRSGLAGMHVQDAIHMMERRKLPQSASIMLTGIDHVNAD